MKYFNLEIQHKGEKSVELFILYNNQVQSGFLKILHVHRQYMLSTIGTLHKIENILAKFYLSEFMCSSASYKQNRFINGRTFFHKFDGSARIGRDIAYCQQSVWKLRTAL